VLNVSRGTSTRLTFDPAEDDFPVWSPDSKSIVFASTRGGHSDLYVKASDGSGDDHLLLKTDEYKAPDSWSRDGRYLLYTIDSSKTGRDLWVLPLEGPKGDPGKPFPFLRTEFNEGAGDFSPDRGGAPRWIAYMSNESGDFEVYVRPLSPNSGGGSSASGGKWMVSRGGGQHPHWRADGKQLFYIGPTGTVMAVDVISDNAFQAGVPKRLFDSGFVGGDYGITADGKRFLFPLPQGAEAQTPFTVLLNWQGGVKK
jgi:Tol biopolymer transport system component